MEQATAKIAQRGDNSPPDYAKQVTDRMAEEYAALASGAEALLAKARQEIPDEVTSDDELALVTKSVVEMRDARGRALASHKAEKEPFLRGGEGVDQFFFGIRDRLNKAMDVIGKRGDAYNQRKLAAEQARRDAEKREAERLAKVAADKLAAEERKRQEAEAAAARARKPENVEAHREVAIEHGKSAELHRVETMIADTVAESAQVAAAQKPAELVRLRHEDGNMSTMKRTPYVVIEDESKLDAAMLWPFIKDDEKLRALKAWAKTTNHKRPMAGAVIEMRDATVYR